jgi:hypothetical protein
MKVRSLADAFGSGTGSQTIADAVIEVLNNHGFCVVLEEDYDEFLAWRLNNQKRFLDAKTGTLLEFMEEKPNG